MVLTISNSRFNHFSCPSSRKILHFQRFKFWDCVVWCKLWPCGVLVCACVKNRLCTFNVRFHMCADCVVFVRCHIKMFAGHLTQCACVFFSSVCFHIVCVLVKLCACVCSRFLCRCLQKENTQCDGLAARCFFFSHEFCFRVFSCCIFHRFFGFLCFS